jgi:hypothetical protein
MKSTLIKTALAGLLALAASAASAGVTVTYIESDKFADLPFAPWERKQVLEELSTYFAKLGEKMPAGQDLAIEVGREYPNVSNGRDLRILKGTADWPIINLRYSLTQNGQVLKGGDARLADMSYMQRIGRFSDSDSLRAEKRMIDEWFDETIIGKKRGG